MDGLLYLVGAHVRSTPVTAAMFELIVSEAMIVSAAAAGDATTTVVKKKRPLRSSPSELRVIGSVGIAARLGALVQIVNQHRADASRHLRPPVEKVCSVPRRQRDEVAA